MTQRILLSRDQVGIKKAEGPIAEGKRRKGGILNAIRKWEIRGPALSVQLSVFSFQLSAFSFQRSILGLLRFLYLHAKFYPCPMKCPRQNFHYHCENNENFTRVSSIWLK
ncbi:hypothetical protein A3860_29090 [Niastella vici]|uniref:Uncharacterized protein n=1 Tax=Niastella vici TaxID=1703345 RepID=A0A1V9FVP0_9BACT|nr:hypothetical protein A3860_29090 [Niastella vici]